MNTNSPAIADRDREFLFTGQDFERVQQMIYARAGISLNKSKQDMVYSRLARRLRATGISNFKDYLALLERTTMKEWEAFVNSLTTNLTSFFREPHHFPLLAEHALKQAKASSHFSLVFRIFHGRRTLFDGDDAGGCFWQFYAARFHHRQRCRYQCTCQGRGGNLPDGACRKALPGYVETFFSQGNRRAGGDGAGEA